MIDFHTHILPGIDDGAKDVSVSAAMLEMEKEQGVNEIVLTPHYYGKFYSPTDFVRRRAAAYEKLLAVAAGEFFFTLGAEIHFSDTLSVNAECRKLAIGDTRYALVELPFGEKWSGSLLTRLRSVCNLNAAWEKGGVALSWEENGLKYAVYRGKDNEKDYRLIGVTSEGRFIDKEYNENAKALLTYKVVAYRGGKHSSRMQGAIAVVNHATELEKERYKLKFRMNNINLE